MQGLTPDTVQAVQLLRKYAERSGYGRGFKVVSALRTCAQQNAIYEQGRTRPGPVVTNAKGCMSWHVHGRAVDIDAPLKDLPHLGKYWESIGGTWGGRFNDPGHFGWHPGVKAWQLCSNPETCEFRAMQPVYPESGNFSGKNILLAAVTGAIAFTIGMKVVKHYESESSSRSRVL